MSYRWCGLPTPWRTEVRVTSPAVSSARSCCATPLRDAPIAAAIVSGADGPWRRRWTSTARRTADGVPPPTAGPGRAAGAMGAGPEWARSDMPGKASKNRRPVRAAVVDGSRSSEDLAVDLDQPHHQSPFAVGADARLERHRRHALRRPRPGCLSGRSRELPPADRVRVDSAVAAGVVGLHAHPQPAADVCVVERLHDAVRVAHEIDVVRARAAPSVHVVVGRPGALAGEPAHGPADPQ